MPHLRLCPNGAYGAYYQWRIQGVAEGAGAPPWRLTVTTTSAEVTVLPVSKIAATATSIFSS